MFFPFMFNETNVYAFMYKDIAMNHANSCLVRLGGKVLSNSQLEFKFNRSRDTLASASFITCQ